ncbi:MAG TPA: glycosyltransferase family 4 protein [Anaerolineae bacterium]|nr:glycosyltransferase family 4 protein [Anaerolineae bacterium]
MKVLFLTAGTEGTASTRVRIYNNLPFFQRAGIETRVMLGPSGRGVLRSHLWRYLAWPDVICVQKALLSPYLLQVLGLTGKPRIFDLDDALFALPSYIVPSDEQRNRMIEQTAEMMRWADIVSVANGYLAKHALRLNAKVVEIPVAVDCDKFYPAGDASAGAKPLPVLGWVGAADGRHFDNVKILAEPLAKLAQKRPFELRLIGIRDDARFAALFAGISGIKVEQVGWAPRPEHVPEQIRQLDVGLAPLLEDPWTLGKSPIKVLEYMASGVLTVGSTVGEITTFIQDGKNGLLAQSADQWVEKLDYALSEAHELEDLRRYAVDTVRTHYSLAAVSAQWVSLLVEAAQMSRESLKQQRTKRERSTR